MPPVYQHIPVNLTIPLEKSVLVDLGLYLWVQFTSKFTIIDSCGGYRMAFKFLFLKHHSIGINIIYHRALRISLIVKQAPALFRKTRSCLQHINHTEWSTFPYVKKSVEPLIYCSICSIYLPVGPINKSFYTKWAWSLNSNFDKKWCWSGSNFSRAYSAKNFLFVNFFFVSNFIGDKKSPKLWLT